MQITTRQLGILIFMNIFAIKALSLPGILLDSVGTDGIFVVAGVVVIELIAWAILIKCFVAFQKEGMRGILEKVIGKVGTKIVYFIVLALFLCKLLFSFNGSALFLHDTLYDEVTWLFTVVPTILLCGFVAYRGIKTVGRTSELVFIFIFIGLLFSYALSFIELEIDGILPILTTPIGEMISAAVKTSVYYGNYLFVFLLIGSVKIEKDFNKKIIFWIALSIGMILTFLFVFYSIYNEPGSVHKYAITDITEFTIKIGLFSKIDWFVSILMLTLLFLEGTIFLYAIFTCASVIIPVKKKNVLFVIVSVVLIIAYLSLQLTPQIIYNLLFGVFSYAAITINFLVPLLMLICLLVNRRKKNVTDTA